MKTIAEQIADLEATRASKAARMSAVMAKSLEEGRSTDAAESTEFDELNADMGQIDADLVRLRALEKIMAKSAVPVTGAPAGPGQMPSVPVIRAVSMEKKQEPGSAFARYVGVMANAKGSVSDALSFAKNRFPDDSGLLQVLGNHDRIVSLQKAAVDIGTTMDADYAAPLVNYQNMANEFIEFLRPQTVIGRIPNLRKVPFNVRVPRQLTGGSASWVGEAKPKPVTSLSLDYVALKYKKLASIAVISDELARFSSPSAETIIRDTIAAAIIQQTDFDFVSPANAGVADVKPASVTNGVTAVVSAGGTVDNINTDMRAIFAPFIAANLTPTNGVWVMSATTALSLSLKLNALGQPAFTGISMTGGTFGGMPVIVSEAVGNIIVLLNAQDILLADDGGVTIDTSREASLQMDSAPADPEDATTVFVSLWQRNLLGIRAERYIDWVKARPASVQYLSGVAY